MEDEDVCEDGNRPGRIFAGFVKASDRMAERLDYDFGAAMRRRKSKTTAFARAKTHLGVPLQLRKRPVFPKTRATRDVQGSTTARARAFR